jgi:hypothetical protein
MNWMNEPERRLWRRSVSDEEFLWLRLFRLLDEIETAIARLASGDDPADQSALETLERLREDMVAAARLAVTEPRREA